ILLGGVLIGGGAFLSTILRFHLNMWQLKMKKEREEELRRQLKEAIAHLNPFFLHPDTPPTNHQDDDEENQNPNNQTPPRGAFLSTIFVRFHRNMWRRQLKEAICHLNPLFLQQQQQQHPDTTPTNHQDDDEEMQQPNNQTHPRPPHGKDIAESSYISKYDEDDTKIADIV
ncbi:hypothetical protein Tco_0107880, partial [Tanacetum coccineum]